MGATPTLSFLPSIGSDEWLVLLAVALIVIGPRRLPGIARKMGRMLETFRRSADDFRRQIERMDEPPVEIASALPPEPPPQSSAPEASTAADAAATADNPVARGIPSDVPSTAREPET